MAIPKDLVAASATPIILSILSNGDSYGYAIIEEVRRASSGQLAWADGMLYPILHRIEKKGLVSSYYKTAENGRKRKYYKLKQSGRHELAQLRRHWTDLHNVLIGLEGERQCFA